VQIDQSVFLKLMVGAFATAILGFFVRGLSTVAFGSETAQVVATPVFVVAVGLAGLAFVLAVLVKIGLIDDQPTEERNSTGG
jgi:uncharacterized membrane protein YuzA (DUF378 family)